MANREGASSSSSSRIALGSEEVVDISLLEEEVPQLSQLLDLNGLMLVPKLKDRSFKVKYEAELEKVKEEMSEWAERSMEEIREKVSAGLGKLQDQQVTADPIPRPSTSETALEEEINDLRKRWEDRNRTLSILEAELSKTKESNAEILQRAEETQRRMQDNLESRANEIAELKAELERLENFIQRFNDVSEYPEAENNGDLTSIRHLTQLTLHVHKLKTKAARWKKAKKVIQHVAQIINEEDSSSDEDADADPAPVQPPPAIKQEPSEPSVSSALPTGATVNAATVLVDQSTNSSQGQDLPLPTTPEVKPSIAQLHTPPPPRVTPATVPSILIRCSSVVSPTPATPSRNHIDDLIGDPISIISAVRATRFQIKRKRTTSPQSRNPAGIKPRNASPPQVKNFLCKYCTDLGAVQAFGTFNSLKDHVKYFHKVKNSYSYLKGITTGCHECGELFRTHKEYMGHYKNAHVNGQKDPHPSGTAADVEKMEVSESETDSSNNN